MREVPIATILGLGMGYFMQHAAGIPRLGGVSEPLAAFFVSFAAVGMARVVGPMSVLVATLAGLIVLLPGLTLTTALSELVTRHLSSGTARLSGAVVSLLAIAFGVALGNRVGAAAFGARAECRARPAAAVGDVGRAGGGAALLHDHLPRRFRDAPWIVLGGALGVMGGRVGAMQFGPELGAFVGSFAVALISTAYERLRKRPAAVVLVPGLLLLVPGSVGFRSITSLMERQAIAGIETAFSTALTSIALVAGLLVAGVVAPEPRLREVIRGARRHDRVMSAHGGRCVVVRARRDSLGLTSTGTTWDHEGHDGATKGTMVKTKGPK